jgi:hypothetical protein
VAAVDEGLLELADNPTWQILAAFMSRRGCAVSTSTAQSMVVGKRHFGLKAVAAGGGGGRQLTRELFDTLLYWQAELKLDERGEASLDIKLNDSLSAFKIVGVATQGAGLFGSGSASITTTQELMLLPGVAPLVREGDHFQAGFTVRNASERRMRVRLELSLTAVAATPKLKPALGSSNPGRPARSPGRSRRPMTPPDSTTT